MYKINRTLHGHLGIRILSSRAESISHSFARCFQHSKIKFVSPSGHLISSISATPSRHFRNEMKNGAEMNPAGVSGIVTGDTSVSYWPIFPSIPRDSPRSLCES